MPTLSNPAAIFTTHTPRCPATRRMLIPHRAGGRRQTSAAFQHTRHRKRPIINSYGSTRPKTENKIRPPLPLFRFFNRSKEPGLNVRLCNYAGHLWTWMVSPVLENTPNARHAARLKDTVCSILSRNLLKNFNVAQMKMLHFAPENFSGGHFQKIVRRYELRTCA